MDPIYEYTERELKEIHLAMVYASYFRHGTAGHNGYMVLAKVAQQAGFGMDEYDKLSIPFNVKQAVSDGKLK